MSYSFNADFTALMGFSPYRWQQRLYDAFLTPNAFPTALDIPTGLGKTATMAIWLLARLKDASLPRRLIYVVDRRAVVDQASKAAATIAANFSKLHENHNLAVSTLRGEHRDNRAWQEDPAGLAIIVGTVDMIGSRLLFGGHGVSRRMRPFHAGLLGTDSLVLLDESHLCAPFQHLVRDIAGKAEFKALEGRGELVPGFRVLSLSATGQELGEWPFCLEAGDTGPELQPAAHARYRAQKRLCLTPVKKGTLDASLADTALELGKRPGRILVYCGRREMARKVAGRLPKGRTQLLVGARRRLERDGVGDWLETHGYVGACRPGVLESSYLVATSAGEVGVDLDADHMVCDLVPFERMVQRLGRVNRSGGAGRMAEVRVYWEEEEGGKGSGEGAGGLEAKILRQLPLIGDGFDASPCALAELMARCPDEVKAASTLPLSRPRLDRAVVDAWAMTGLREHPGRPPVGAWLRGWEPKQEEEIDAIWRRWLPWRLGEAQPDSAELEAYCDAAPPQAGEVLRIEPSRLARVLLERAKAIGQPSTPAILVFDRALDFVRGYTAAELAGTGRETLVEAFRPGLVVIAAGLGGMDSAGLLDAKAGGVAKCLDQDWPVAEGVRIRLGADEGANDGDWKLVGEIALANDEGGPVLRIEVKRDRNWGEEGDPAVRRKRQSLGEHTEWVKAEAERLGKELGLPDEYRQVLEVAARLHDLGKDRALWQNAMRTPRAGRPWAKSDRGCVPRWLRIGADTYRHEFGSLAEAERDEELATLPPELRELALHLIAAHHGEARPVIAAVDPNLSASSEVLAARARQVALRFAALQRRWGPWGLAWWEALLRAADQRGSRRLDGEPSGAAHG